KLRTYHWPGNIRELENVISRAVIFMDIMEKEINKHHLPDLFNDQKVTTNQIIGETKQSLQEAVDKFEKEYIHRIFTENKYNKTKTAKQLQISVRSLYYKIEKYQIE